MTDAEKLARAIEWSGMSARWFAEDVLLCDERTIRGWLEGGAPIPKQVMSRVSEFLAGRYA